MTAPSTALDLGWAGLRKRHPAPESIKPIDRKYTPFPGPQEAFDRATEFEILYGGAKGPGKSHALLYKPLQWMHRALCKVLFLRVDFPSLVENMDRAQRTFPQFDAVWNERDRRWTFPSGARYEFGYAETMKDVRRYAGREPTIVCYDQLEQLADENVWAALLAELRSPDPTIPRQGLASANPGGPGEPWLMKRWVTPCGEYGERVAVEPNEPMMTRRFIPARVTDNPIYAHDAKYMATLRALPQRQRAQKLEGKWGIGSGRGLEELNERMHIVPPFTVPDHWFRWGAFDWGFNHPFAFGEFVADEDGTIYLVESVHGHKMLPWEQAERIQARAHPKTLTLVYAGRDCWNEMKARGENTPTIAETFLQHRITLVRANTDRVHGLNNMREYVKWHGPGDVIWRPRFFLLDTPGNRRTFDVLESMVSDPDDPEDVLKRDADPDTGEGGDDPYDMVRYGMAARPAKARKQAQSVVAQHENVDRGVDLSSGRPVNPRSDAHRDRLMEQFQREQAAIRAANHGHKRSMRGKPTRSVPL